MNPFSESLIDRLAEIRVKSQEDGRFFLLY
jgi:hypothetical protein